MWVLLATGAALAGCGKGDSEYDWLILNYRSHAHTISVEVNGKHHATFDRAGGGFDAKPLPFHDGLNTITVAFTERPGRQEGPFRSSSLQVVLGPSMMPPPEALVLDFIETEEAAAEVILEVEMASGRPGRLIRRDREWADAARAQLVFEYRGEGNALAGRYEAEHVRRWMPDGHLMQEVETQGDRLTTATYYRPDGSVGAEICGGNGWVREWYESGALYREVPCVEGNLEGEEKTFYESGPVESVRLLVADEANGPHKKWDEQGNLLVRGAFKDGEKDGVWITYDRDGREIERTVYRAGEVVEGDQGP